MVRNKVFPLVSCRDHFSQVPNKVSLLFGKLTFQTQNLLDHRFLLVLQGLYVVEQKLGLFHGLLTHVGDVPRETAIAFT